LPSRARTSRSPSTVAVPMVSPSGALRIGASSPARRNARAWSVPLGAGGELTDPPALAAAPGVLRPTCSVGVSDGDQIQPVRRTRVQPGRRSSSSRSVPSSKRATMVPDGSALRFSPPVADTVRSIPSRSVVCSDAVHTQPSRDASVHDPETPTRRSSAPTLTRARIWPCGSRRKFSSTSARTVACPLSGATVSRSTARAPVEARAPVFHPPLHDLGDPVILS
jgi:hypothetical protein